MKFLFTFIFIMCLSVFHAQSVGIGTPSPNPKAILDVESTNKGLLLPRLVDTLAVSAPVPAGTLNANGSAGTSGQVLTSNGAGAPTWVNPTNSIYNSAVRLSYSGNIFTVPANSTYYDIPELTYTFNSAGNTLLSVNCNVLVNTSSCGCTFTNAEIALEIDNIIVWSNSKTLNIAYNDQIIKNYLTTVGNVSHTIKYKIRAFPGGSNEIRILGDGHALEIAPTIMNIMLFKQ